MVNGHVLLSVGEKCSTVNVQRSMFNVQCSTVNVQRFNRFSAWRERSFPQVGQSFPTCGTGCSHWRDTYLSAGLFPTHKTPKDITKTTKRHRRNHQETSLKPQNIILISPKHHPNITKIAKTSPKHHQNITSLHS